MPPDEPCDAARAWLRHAWQDWAVAELLFSRPSGEALLGIAGYHSQQAAEKALKAVLIARGGPLARTHDLVVLLQMLAAFEPDANQWVEEAARLNPFSTAYRYHGELEPLTVAEAEMALADAKRLVDGCEAMLRLV